MKRSKPQDAGKNEKPALNKDSDRILTQKEVEEIAGGPGVIPDY